MSSVIMNRMLTLSILFFFISYSFNCKKKEREVEVKGIINIINGDVKLILKDGKIKRAEIGDAINYGMKIKTTGEKSFIDIYFGENAIKILGNTLVEIKKLIANIDRNTEEYEFFVNNGRMFSRVKRKLSKGDLYHVITPTTTAGVRGTDFLVSEEGGKGNVACLSGLVSVLNNSLSDEKVLVLQEKEETDVIPGEDMMKKQLSETRLRMLNILLEIKEMREDIRRKYEDQREEIRKYVVDQREKDKNLLEEQREKDRVLVEGQKKRDREQIEGIKEKAKTKGDEAIEDAKGIMEEAKEVDKESAKKDAQDKMQSMKPKIEKYKLNKDQFKGKK